MKFSCVVVELIIIKQLLNRSTTDVGRIIVSDDQR